MTNFTTGTRSCCGGNPLVKIPKVHGFFFGMSWYNDDELDAEEDDEVEPSSFVAVSAVEMADLGFRS